MTLPNTCQQVYSGACLSVCAAERLVELRGLFAPPREANARRYSGLIIKILGRDISRQPTIIPSSVTHAHNSQTTAPKPTTATEASAHKQHICTSPHETAIDETVTASNPPPNLPGATPNKNNAPVITLHPAQTLTTFRNPPSRKQQPPLLAKGPAALYTTPPLQPLLHS